MAIYLPARWHRGHNAGGYLGGPWRIVWHTTEGASAEAAIGQFASKNSWPHFTVDEARVFQHVDTDFAARSLENRPGGVETNRWHAVQIEMVAYAALPKSAALLARAARLARWIERTHGVPQVWPNGFPRPASNGKDPGGHNRDPSVWEKQGGHYGHCHVPENSHWDPGTIDVNALMAPDPSDVGDFPDPPAGIRYA